MTSVRPDISLIVFHCKGILLFNITNAYIPQTGRGIWWADRHTVSGGAETMSTTITFVK